MVIEYFSLFYLLFLKSSPCVLFVKYVILFDFVNKYNILYQNFSFLFFLKKRSSLPCLYERKISFVILQGMKYTNI